MTKRSKLWIVATILIGGVAMFFSINNSTEQEIEAAMLRKEQKSIALYIADKYKDVKNIQFTDISKNNVTGSTTMELYVNDTNLLFVTFYNFDSKDYVLRKNPETFKLTENFGENITSDKSNIQIRYYEK